MREQEQALTDHWARGCIFHLIVDQIDLADNMQADLLRRYIDEGTVVHSTWFNLLAKTRRSMPTSWKRAKRRCTLPVNTDRLTAKAHEMNSATPSAVSLFSNCGAGDVGYAKAGFSFRVMAEIEQRRLAVALANHKHACGVPGDLRFTWREVIASFRSDAGPSGQRCSRRARRVRE